MIKYNYPYYEAHKDTEKSMFSPNTFIHLEEACPPASVDTRSCSRDHRAERALDCLFVYGAAFRNSRYTKPSQVLIGW